MIIKSPFSKIIAGTMTWGIWGKNLDKKQMIDLMNFCLETGITTFDHADIYGGYTNESDFGTAFGNLPSSIYHLMMPAVAVGFYSLSRNARLVRSSMLEVLGQDYVRTARSKGISERAVVINHALRNAWLPVVTMIGLEFGFLLGGVVVIETVFSWPGIGRLVFNAINQRDISVVQASVIVLSVIFIALNLIVDLIYVRIDPRVKL